MRLREPSLLRSACLIGGEWIVAGSHATIPVVDPALGERLAEVPDLGAIETQRAITAAKNAFAAWRKVLAKDRAQILRRWHDLILQHQEDLAVLMTSEQGKPLSEARGEIAYAASFIDWYAAEAKRVRGDLVATHRANARVLVLKEPIGVVAAITPWNFPAAMITRKCAPALAAGCTVIVKPAPQTPLSALALGELAQRAGFPAGVLNIITGDAVTIGRELTASPEVRKLSFTGSTEVGRLLMAQCAPTVKKVALELGGNAPFLVFDDADLDAAVSGAMLSKYRNAGQTCVCANRFLVHDRVFDAFAAKLVEQARALTIGHGLDQGVQLGPLIDQDAIVKVEAHIADALAHGARLLCGGKRHARGGTFFEPTVLAGVTPAMRIAHEETFGPVAPLCRFRDDAEAIALANDTEYGLAAYFYSRDLSRIWRLAEALEFGIIGVNEGIISTETAPFGGLKQSGIGREGSTYGIDEFLELKYVLLGGV